MATSKEYAKKIYEEVKREKGRFRVGQSVVPPQVRLSCHLTSREFPILVKPEQYWPGRVRVESGLNSQALAPFFFCLHFFWFTPPGVEPFTPGGKG